MPDGFGAGGRFDGFIEETKRVLRRTGCLQLAPARRAGFRRFDPAPFYARMPDGEAKTNQQGDHGGPAQYLRRLNTQLPQEEPERGDPQYALMRVALPVAHLARRIIQDILEKPSPA